MRVTSLVLASAQGLGQGPAPIFRAFDGMRRGPLPRSLPPTLHRCLGREDADTSANTWTAALRSQWRNHLCHCERSEAIHVCRTSTRQTAVC